MGLSPTHRVASILPKLAVEKSPFQFAAKRFKIDESVNRLCEAAFVGTLLAQTVMP